MAASKTFNVLRLRQIQGLYQRGRSGHADELFEDIGGDDEMITKKIIEDNLPFYERLLRIIRQQGISGADETVGEVLKRAASSGDQDAKDLIASGALERNIVE
jgi:hypothetical protein